MSTFKKQLMLKKGGKPVIKNTGQLLFEAILTALKLDKAGVVDFASQYIPEIDMNDSNKSIAIAIRSYVKRNKYFRAAFINFMQGFRGKKVSEASQKRNADGSVTWVQSVSGNSIDELFNTAGANPAVWQQVLDKYDGMPETSVRAKIKENSAMETNKKVFLFLGVAVLVYLIIK